MVDIGRARHPAAFADDDEIAPLGSWRQYSETVMGLPLILIDQIPLNLLQQLELLSLNLVALAQLVGNPLQPVFKPYRPLTFTDISISFPPDVISGLQSLLGGCATNVPVFTRDGKNYSLNGINAEKGTRFPGAWRRYREHMKALYHWLVLTIIRTHEPTIGRLVACLFPVGLGAVLGTSSFFGCQCLRGI